MLRRWQIRGKPLKSCSKMEPSINAKGEEGWTLLHCCGSWQMLGRPLKSCSKTEPTSTSGTKKAGRCCTAAALANARQTAEVLLQNGADINAKGQKRHYTPALLRQLANARETAEVLLQNGADINAKATLHASISPHYTTFLDKTEVGDDERELEDSTPLHAAVWANASCRPLKSCSKTEPTSTPGGRRMAGRCCTMLHGQMRERPLKSCSKTEPISTPRLPIALRRCTMLHGQMRERPLKSCSKTEPRSM